MQQTPIPLPEGQAADARAAVSSSRLPHLTAEVFCATSGTRQALEKAIADRRLTRVRTEMHDGGVAEACRRFERRKTPALLVVEMREEGEDLLRQLDRLADVCDPDTRVVVVGPSNDVNLYRHLIASGIADYLVTPVSPLSYVATVQRLFAREDATRLGKLYAFIGAKGGTGVSTIAQNVAWTIAEEQHSPTLLLDLDFRFGTAGLNLDLKPTTGIERYLGEPGKLDPALLDRLIVSRGEYLKVLPGADDPLGDFDPDPAALERLVDIARESFPIVVLDLPHDWSPATRDAVTAADEVIVVASPDLANLGNAKLLVDRLRALRPNDAPPRVILNGCRVPRRKEIDAARFAKNAGVTPCATIAFDPAIFGAAAADGRTLREQAPRSAAQKALRKLSRDLTGLTKSRRAGGGRLRRLFGRG